MHYRNHRIAPKGFVWIALAIGVAIVFSAQPAKPSAPIAVNPQPITLAMLADIVKPVCTPQTRTITKFGKATSHGAPRSITAADRTKARAATFTSLSLSIST